MAQSVGPRMRIERTRLARNIARRLTLAALLAAGAALAANGQSERSADSAGRADDIVTQDDVRGFAEAFVGKPGAAPRTTSSVQELNAMAQAINPVAAEDGRTEVRLGEARIGLLPPPGHCFLDEAQPSDARLVGMLQSVFRGELRMLGAFADCAQLPSWRSGQRKTLSDYGQFLVPLGFIDKKLDGPSKPYVETICKVMRDTGGELMAQSAPGVKQRFEQALEGAQMNEVRFLGVVGEDDSACYFGLLQKLVTEHGDPKTQVNVATISFIAGKMIYTNLYAVHEGDHTLSELFERQKTNVARNLRVNGG